MDTLKSTRNLLPYCMFAICIFCVVISLLLICLNSTYIPTEKDEILQLNKPVPSPPPEIFAQVLVPTGDSFCTNLDYLVVVHCKVNDSTVRNYWRKLYGPLRTKFKFDILFAIGKPEDAAYQQYLIDEALTNNDLLQAEYNDTSKQATDKHISWLRYVNKHCRDVGFVFRLDDYSAWNVKAVTEYIINRKKLKLQGITCEWRYNSEVIRRRESKWYVPVEDFPNPRYPHYCIKNRGYIISQNDISRLLAFAYVTSSFWMDDVYVTGILRNSAGVNIIDDQNFYSGSLREFDSTQGSMSEKANKTIFRQLFEKANIESKYVSMSPVQ